MNNKYPNTPLLRKLFENFRTRKIYYSYDEFGRLFDRSGPWAMYFEKGRMITKNKNGDKIEKPKSVYVSFEFIRNFFIVEYNDYLFHKKLREYGEEPFAYQIAKQIVKVRENKPIETTFQLVDVIKSVLPQKVLKKVGHPAKQTFQAIRIEVNRELEVLETALKDACEMLNSKGRVAVITFNSLEDRIVKRYFNSLTKEEVTSRYLPSSNKELDYILVNNRVIIASDEELGVNNRAKPAKLRVIERK